MECSIELMWSLKEATLAARLIDRPLRPLFPKGFRNEVQVIATVLSSDGKNDAIRKGTSIKKVIRSIEEIQSFWPEYDPTVPITLYDLTEMDNNVRRVLSLGVDYFGGAFKKPNLTMVWNKAETEGLVSYHAGCTSNRVLKGLSGTGKTTLTVGSRLEQDDACLGKPIYKNDKISRVELIGLEAASFAKSEGLTHSSPEYPGLMKSREIEKDAIEARKEQHRNEAEGLAKKLAGVAISISKRVGEEDKLYGSVTSSEIAEKLLEIGINIDKRKILMEEPLKTLR